MIEMLGVLAIVGVLSAGGIAGYNMAMQSYKTNLLIERIQLIATRARAVYKGYYNGISASNLINSGKLSSDNFKNPFGGDITIRNSTTWEPNALFSIDIKDFSKEACIDLLLTDWGNTSVFEGVYTKGTGNVILRYSNGKWPVTMTDAVTYCNNEITTLGIVFK